MNELHRNHLYSVRIQTAKAARLLCYILAVMAALALTAIISRFSQVYAAASDTITITTTEDNTDPCTPAACSLRAAIILANSNPDVDTIVVPAGEYFLTLSGANEDNAATGDLDILGPIIIQGAGAQQTIIDGNALDRVFHLRDPGGEAFQVILENMTIRNGEIDDAGGGIFVGSGVNLRLEHAVVQGNRSTSGDGGGGLYLQGSTTTVIRNSTLSTNESSFRGGAVAANDVLVLENTTVSGNTAIQGGGVYGNGDVRARNATITDNTATGGLGPGVYIALGTSMVNQNTIIAANVDGDCTGAIDSNGYNLVSSSCPLATTANDLMEDDPGLAPLALNNGETPTHALLPDSLAIDAGSDDEPGTTTNACLTHDQRGIVRPIDGNGDRDARCDIGAFEYEPPPDLIYLPFVLR